MDHIKILKRAFQITWKYRTLWLIGLLLVLAGGGVMGGSAPSAPSGGPQASSDGEGWRDMPDAWRNTPQAWSEVWDKIGPIVVAVGVVLLALIALGLIIGIVAIVVRYVTRGSLIRMVDAYEESETQVRFGEGFRMGWSRSAFRLFLISLMLKLPIALLMIALIVPLVGFAVASFIEGSGGMIALGVVLILLIIPVSLLGAALGVIVGPVIQVSYRACVLEGLGAWEAVKSGVGLIRRNLGATALQWLLLVGLGIGWRIALIPVNLMLVLLGLVIGGLPALAVGGLTGLAAGWPWGLGLGALMFVPLFLLLVAVPNVALDTLATVYHSTVWTLTYRELLVIDRGDEASEDEDSGTEVLDAKAPDEDAPEG